MIFTPAAFSGSARFSGVWPPNCTITPTSAPAGFMLVDGHHVFEGQRLEVEAVAGVVVGGDRLRIAVHHDGFVTVFAQGKRRVTAAVIELNALPDAVRPAAQDHHFLLRRRRRLVFVLVGRIQVRRVALELGCAGVHALVDRGDTMLLAQLHHPLRPRHSVQMPDVRQPRIVNSPCAWLRAARSRSPLPAEHCSSSSRSSAISFSW